MNKQFNASLLDPSVCPNGHFGVRLVTYANASTIRWGAVIGLGETFTFEVCARARVADRQPPAPAPSRAAQELASFPLYIINNHGDVWAQLPWTLPLIAVLVPVIDVVAAAATWYRPRRWVPSIVQVPCTVRSWLLQFSAWAYAIFGLECLVHLIVAQVGATFGYEFFVALLVVIGFANGAMYLLVILIWNAHLYDLGCFSDPWWAFAEVSLGLGAVVVLGGGVFVGPACLVLDALYRLTELLPEKPVARRAEDEIALGDLSEL